MADVEITYNNNTIVTMSSSGTEILETEGTFLTDDITVQYTKPTPTLQSKSATPTESAQTITPDSGYDGLSQVSVGAISSSYVGSNVPRQAAQTITPTTTDQTIASGKYLTGTQTIEGIVCTNLTAANIANGVTVKIGTATDDDSVASVTGTLQGGYSESLIKQYIQRDTSFTNITFPSGMTKIGEYAFAGCTYFNPSSLPSSITSIGDYAFYNSRLTSLTSLPNGVTSIGTYAFYSTKVNLTSFPSSLTFIGAYAFFGCQNLVGSFTMPSSVTTINSDAFSACNYITSMDLSGCTSMTKIKDSVFESCVRLSSVTLPSSVTEIGSYAFRYCISLGSFSCNNAITKLGTYVFNGGGGYAMILRTVSLPNLSASALSYVFGGTDASKACKQLEFVDLGSAQSISSSCFANCYALTTLVLRRTGAVCSLGSSNAFTNTPMSGYNSLTGTVYVPSALISTYQTASNWSALYNAGNVTFVAIEGSEYEL